MSLTTIAAPSAAPQTSSARAGRLGADWNRLWAAGAVSMFGDGVYLAAMPLLAASKSTDPRAVALVAASAGVPWLLFALASGTLVDRLDRRRLILGAQSAQLLLVVALALLSAADAVTIGMLCVLAFCLSSAETVFREASEALLPAVVPSQHLITANSRQQASMFIAEDSLGPAAGAALFAVSASVPFGVDAVTFAVSLVLIARIRRRPEFRVQAVRQPLRVEVLTGLRWLRGNRMIRTLVGMAALANFTTFMTLSTLVLFAKEVLHLGEVGYGLLVSGIALGGVVGSLVSQRVVARLGLRTTLLLVPFCSSLVVLSVGLFGRNPVQVGLLVAVSSLGLSLWNVVSYTLRQIHVPSELLGRVGGAARTISYGVGPLGALAGGLLAHRWGLAAPWIVAGVLRLLLSLPALPVLFAHRFPSPASGADPSSSGDHGRPAAPSLFREFWRGARRARHAVATTPAAISRRRAGDSRGALRRRGSRQHRPTR
jgi:MFS family permease